jgi:hypothetical protein
MKTRGTVIAAALAAGLALVGAESPEELCDAFEDGDPFDGVPVLWERLFPGDFTAAESGGLYARNTRAADTLLLSENGAFFTGDIKVRVRASFNNTYVPPNGVNPPRIAVSLHTRGDGVSFYQAYYGSVSAAGIVKIVMWPDYEVQSTQLALSGIGSVPAEEDLDIELLRCGNNLELRVWRSHDQRPLKPQCSAFDASLHTGRAGFGCFVRSGNPIILRSMCITPTPAGCSRFRRGDTNVDGALDIADAILIISYLFGEGQPPTCLDAADGNDDGLVDIADAIAVLGYLFGEAGDLAEPFPGCGVDPTADGLGCISYDLCE